MTISINKTDEFAEWLAELTDLKARLRIRARILAMEDGNFSDHKLLPDSHGLFEMRVDYGPGYRVYYGRTGRTVYLLVAGGTKRSQKADIAQAKSMWLRIKESAHAHETD